MSALNFAKKKMVETEEPPKKKRKTGKRNFPPCYPIFRVSIGDIEGAPKRMLAIAGFINFLVYSLLFLLNFILCCTNFVAAIFGECKDVLTVQIRYPLLSLVWIGLIPVSFGLQWLPLYWALQTTNPLFYLWFFIDYILQGVILVGCSVGLSSIGTGGFLGTMLLILAAQNKTIAWVKVVGGINAVWGLLFILFGLYFILFVVIVYLLAFKKDNEGLMTMFKSVWDNTKQLRDGAKQAANKAKNLKANATKLVLKNAL